MVSGEHKTLGKHVVTAVNTLLGQHMVSGEHKIL